MKAFPWTLLFVILAASLLQAFTHETINVPSERMDRTIPVTVIIPNSYTTSQQNLPVLYLLHGYGNNNLRWKQATPIGDLADTYNILVVCPDGANSWYFDSFESKYAQYETFVAKELVEYIDRHYKTLPNRNSRAIAGISMGGHGAMFLAIRHKDTFGAVSSMSGGVDIRPFPNEWEIAKALGTKQQHPDRWEEHTVINLAKKLQDNDLAISIECGESDFFIGVNRALHQQLLEQKISHDYTERRGGHGWDYWKNCIKYQMLFISEYFKKSMSDTKSSSINK